MALEIEDRLKKFLTYPGVTGWVVINHEGIPIKTSLTDNAVAVQYSALVTRFIAVVKNAVRQIDSTNELMWTRLRSKQEELIFIPDREFIVVLIQKPTI